jgi:hypothetical protein
VLPGCGLAIAKKRHLRGHARLTAQAHLSETKRLAVCLRLLHDKRLLCSRIRRSSDRGYQKPLTCPIPTVRHSASLFIRPCANAVGITHVDVNDSTRGPANGSVIP